MLNIAEIHNTDCIEFMETLSKDYIDLIIADFPYNEVVKASWDNCWENDEVYLSFIKKCIYNFSRIIRSEGNLIIYCSRQFEHKFKNILEECGFKEQRTIIWSRKRDRNTTRGKTMSSGYEPILWYSKDSKKRTYNNIKVPVTDPKLLKRKEYQKGGILEGGVSLSDVWSDIPSLSHNSKEKTKHPTQKPLKLCDRVIEVFSDENDLVYIPFAGSGSEIESCIRNNRNYIATELEKDYVDNIILPRIAKISL